LHRKSLFWGNKKQFASAYGDTANKELELLHFGFTVLRPAAAR